MPESGHSFAGDTSLELVLTATDTDGIQTETSVMLEPENAPVALATPARARADDYRVSHTESAANTNLARACSRLR